MEVRLKVQAAAVWLGRDCACLDLEAFWRKKIQTLEMGTFGRRFKLVRRRGSRWAGNGSSRDTRG